MTDGTIWPTAQFLHLIASFNDSTRTRILLANLAYSVISISRRHRICATCKYPLEGFLVQTPPFDPFLRPFLITDYNTDYTTEQVLAVTESVSGLRNICLFNAAIPADKLMSPGTWLRDESLSALVIIT